jgi:pyruvate/2-oxoglutarate dehydrogenase complex dihydrolipoamide dehydrogenase (E3) component
MMLVNDPHDQKLIQNCHPPGWVNPKPSGKYNLVVIGAGTAGLVSAAGAAGLGAKVALIERNLMGGDCLNVGCVPSKGVIRASRAVYDARDASPFGVRTNGVDVDFSEAMERMRRLRASISNHDSAERFQSLGVDVFVGNGRFVGPSAIAVNGSRLEFDRAVIATGARPQVPPIAGIEEAGYYTNETVFTLTELPRRLAVIGAGPIGCELAQAFKRFGSGVTILTDGKAILPKEDEEASAFVRKQIERDGISIVTGAKVAQVRREGQEKVLVWNRDGLEETLACDAILIAVGRAANVERLGLDAAGVKATRHGVVVDDRLRTTNPRIYAAGDVCSRYKFTHAADAMARIVLANALFYGRRKASALVVPWCTYTDPEIAHVGYYEKDATEAGFQVLTITEPLNRVDRAVLDGEEEGMARVHYDRKTGKILGGTIVARHAGEMIGELSLAITTGQKMDALSATIHPYPTQAEVWKKIGDAYMRAKLTPRVKRIFKKWLAWKR